MERRDRRYIPVNSGRAHVSLGKMLPTNLRRSYLSNTAFYSERLANKDTDFKRKRERFKVGVDAKIAAAVHVEDSNF